MMLVSCVETYFFVTDRLGTCYAGIFTVSPRDKTRLVIAGCHLARTVYVGVHLTTHHEPFGSAAPLIVASFSVVKHDSCDSCGRPGNCGDNNAEHPEATCALLEINWGHSCWDRDTYTIVLRVHVRFPQRTPSNKSHHGRRQVQTSGDNGGICWRLSEIDNRVIDDVLLQSVIELARYYFETSGNNPVCKDPVMRCQRHRDHG